MNKIDGGYYMIVVVENAEDAFGCLCSALWKTPEYICKPRNLEVREIINCSIEITKPYLNMISHPARKMNYRYLIGELVWYLRADSSSDATDHISQYSKFWDKIKDEDGILYSNYGTYSFAPLSSLYSHIHYKTTNSDDISQFEWCIKKLKNDKDSRQACININSVYHKTITNCKDFPCTYNLQFMIRDDTLLMIVNMRSTDLIKGFCIDQFQFSSIQRYMLSCLKTTYSSLKLGSMFFNTASIHVYESDYSIIKAVSESERYYYLPVIDNLHEFTYNTIKQLVSFEESYRKNNYTNHGDVLLSCNISDPLALYYANLLKK